MVLLTPNKVEREKALAYFLTLEGAKASHSCEIWIPVPGSVDAKDFMETHRLLEPWALVLLDPSGTDVERRVTGKHCPALGKALAQLLAPPLIYTKEFRAWAGSGADPRLFLDFAAARAKDPGAGAQEPYRSWLMGLMKGNSPQTREWAAARLVEADAIPTAGEPSPFTVYLKAVYQQFEEKVFKGKVVPVPWQMMPQTLGDLNLLPDAPCWSVIRTALRKRETPLSLPMYAFMAPHLIAEDRDWILKRLGSASKVRWGRVDWDTRYWIATDWLLAFGRPQDWEEFRPHMEKAGWGPDFNRLLSMVKAIPAYWDSEAKIQELFSEGAAQERFWANPSPKLATWGITRQSLQSENRILPDTEKLPSAPDFPGAAWVRGISGDIQVRLTVGGDHKVKWVRPRPGHALAHFAPPMLAYSSQWQFLDSKTADNRESTGVVLIVWRRFSFGDVKLIPAPEPLFRPERGRRR